MKFSNAADVPEAIPDHDEKWWWRIFLRWKFHIKLFNYHWQTYIQGQSLKDSFYLEFMKGLFKKLLSRYEWHGFRNLIGWALISHETVPFRYLILMNAIQIYHQCLEGHQIIHRIFNNIERSVFLWFWRSLNVGNTINLFMFLQILSGCASWSRFLRLSPDMVILKYCKWYNAIIIYMTINKTIN